MCFKMGKMISVGKRTSYNCLETKCEYRKYIDLDM